LIDGAQCNLVGFAERRRAGACAADGQEQRGDGEAEGDASGH
jgi:hypothetical protein